MSFAPPSFVGAAAIRTARMPPDRRRDGEQGASSAGTPATPHAHGLVGAGGRQRAHAASDCFSDASDVAGDLDVAPRAGGSADPAASPTQPPASDITPFARGFARVPTARPLQKQTVLTPAIMFSWLRAVFGDRHPGRDFVAIRQTLQGAMGIKPGLAYTRACVHACYGAPQPSTYRISDRSRASLALAAGVLNPATGRMTVAKSRNPLALSNSDAVDSTAVAKLLMPLRDRQAPTSSGPGARERTATQAPSAGPQNRPPSALSQAVDILVDYHTRGQRRPHVDALMKAHGRIASEAIWQEAVNAVYGCRRCAPQTVPHPRAPLARTRVCTTAQEEELLALVRRCPGRTSRFLWRESKREARLNCSKKTFDRMLDTLVEISKCKGSYFLAGSESVRGGAHQRGKAEQVWQDVMKKAVKVSGSRDVIISTAMVKPSQKRMLENAIKAHLYQTVTLAKTDPLAQALTQATGGRPPKCYRVNPYAVPPELGRHELARQIVRLVRDSEKPVRGSELRRRWNIPPSSVVVKQLCEEGLLKKGVGGYRLAERADAWDGLQGPNPSALPDTDLDESTSEGSDAASEPEAGGESPTPPAATPEPTTAGALRSAMRPGTPLQERRTLAAPRTTQRSLPAAAMPLLNVCNALRALAGAPPTPPQVLHDFLDANGFTPQHVDDPAWVAHVLQTMDPTLSWSISSVELQDVALSAPVAPISRADAQTCVRAARPAVHLMRVLAALPQRRAVLCLGGPPHLVPLARGREGWYCPLDSQDVASSAALPVEAVLNEYLASCILKDAGKSFLERMRPDARRERSWVHILTS